MSRPSLRVRGALAALGALCIAILLAVSPAPGRAETQGTQTPAPGGGAAGVAPVPVAGIAIAADVVPNRRRLDVLAGRRASVRGAIRPGVVGRRVSLQRRTGRRWTTVTRTRTRTGGAFTLSARIRRPLSAPVRIRVAGGGGLRATGERIGRLNVYRRALVSWYGPGFYGNRLGCGGRLGFSQLGVAHKSLPCGSKVTLRHHGRSVRVRVIDRGPYVGSREFDLTRATKERLRFGGVGSILVTR